MNCSNSTLSNTADFKTVVPGTKQNLHDLDIGIGDPTTCPKASECVCRKSTNVVSGAPIVEHHHDVECLRFVSKEGARQIRDRIRTGLVRQSPLSGRYRQVLECQLYLSLRTRSDGGDLPEPMHSGTIRNRERPPDQICYRRKRVVSIHYRLQISDECRQNINSPSLTCSTVRDDLTIGFSQVRFARQHHRRRESTAGTSTREAINLKRPLNTRQVMRPLHGVDDRVVRGNHFL